jgi:phosphopantothenoylcysteine decarboxylase/phosphopantothenate--cysteine ligase
MRILITAGPTREYIDDIRFISNGSSGLMGLALAKEAADRGHEVTVVSGPMNLTPIYGVRFIPVVSSDEMTDKTLEELSGGYQLLISAAAIGDYTPQRRFRGKLRSARQVTLKLKPTRKLIREARLAHPKLTIVAFKAEYNKTKNELVKAASRLLTHADLVVANDVSKDVFGSLETEAYLVGKNIIRLPRMTKAYASKRIFDSIESCFFQGRQYCQTKAPLIHRDDQ